MKITFYRLLERIGSFTFRVYLRMIGIKKKSNYKVISLGLGQQSTTLYLMSSLGIIERADFAIFADPGAEGSGTYKYLKWLKKWSKKNNGIPIVIIGKKNIYDDLIQATKVIGKRFASIPAFTMSSKGKVGMLRRQCTEEYKSNQVFQVIRKAYGIESKKRTPDTEIWLGISLEEMERAKFPRRKWMTYVYPFLNMKATKHDFERKHYTKIMRRADCLVWLEENKFPIPPKSACKFCPYQGDARWLETKTNDPEEWLKLVHLDKAIRNSTKKGVLQPIFLHRSCKPLDEVDLNENQQELFLSECSGTCGV